jgi:gluconolactonase
MGSIEKFQLTPEKLRRVGSGLSRPECIIAEPDGTLWISDNRSAVVRLDPDGRQTRIGNVGGDPNGLAMDREGNIYIANVTTGKVDKLFRDGHHEEVLAEVDGVPIAEAANFVYLDRKDRLWVTVSTRVRPRRRAIDEPVADGYVVLVDRGVARIAADGFLFTNEVRMDDSGEFLYVAETTAGRITRLRVRDDGTLTDREVYGPDPLVPGAHIDGICFDAEGNLWITELSRNALLVLSPAGGVRVVFEDPDGSTMYYPTSLTFGGADLRTAYVGSLKVDHLVAFDSPVAGQPMRHWR